MGEIRSTGRDLQLNCVVEMAPSTLADLDLLEAARRGILPMVQKALKDGANINGSDESGRNALMHAAAKGHAVKEGPDKVLEVLINAKAALDMNDHAGWTAVHYAVAK